MKIWTGATIPNGYLLCDGRAISRQTYKTLFSVIGTTYGEGDGSSTFNLPDMRDRFPQGANGNLGENIDASKGETKIDGTLQNDVYGKSNTVQPPAVAINYIIKY